MCVGGGGGGGGGTQRKNQPNETRPIFIELFCSGAERERERERAISALLPRPKTRNWVRQQSPHFFLMLVLYNVTALERDFGISFRGPLPKVTIH